MKICRIYVDIYMCNKYPDSLKDNLFRILFVYYSTENNYSLSVINQTIEQSQ